MTFVPPFSVWQAGDAALSRRALSDPESAAGHAPEHGTQPVQDAGRWSEPGVHAIIVRVTGGKPLRFQGELLAEGSSRRAGAALWHEIAIYACANGGFAGALRLRGAAVETDRAMRFADLPALETWLEEVDPAADLHAGFDVADPGLSGATLALRAASLRGRADELRRAYQALLGELLFALEAELVPG